MKLVWGAHNIALTFHENEVLVLTIEKARIFAAFVQNVYWQCAGEEGELVLSEKDMLISMEDSVSMVWNPFVTDINEKKVINKLYQEMKRISDEEFYRELGEISQSISQYLNELSMKIPYAISFNEGVDSLAIYKLCGVKLENEEVDLLQKLMEYIKVLSLLSNVKVVIFINLKAYLDDMQLLELYKISFYYKIGMVLIENNQKHSLECEKHFILDQDECLIEL